MFLRFRLIVGGGGWMMEDTNSDVKHFCLIILLQKLEILTINISLLCNFQRNKRINRIYQLLFPNVRIIFCRGGILSVMCCETNQVTYQMFPDGIIRKKEKTIKIHCVMHQLFTFLSSVATCKKGYYTKNIKYT